LLCSWDVHSGSGRRLISLSQAATGPDVGRAAGAPGRASRTSLPSWGGVYVLKKIVRIHYMLFRFGYLFLNAPQIYSTKDELHLNLYDIARYTLNF